jgi:hypothetical protein
MDLFRPITYSYHELIPASLYRKYKIGNPTAKRFYLDTFIGIMMPDELAG